MSSDTGIEDRVAIRLSAKYDVDVSIDQVEHLLSDGYVARFWVTGNVAPRRVVVKRVTDRRFDRTSGTAAPSRALNEIAALSFFAEQGAAVGPDLIDWDETDGLVIFEDLGPLPTLESLLWDPEAGDPTPGLLAMADSLAHMHGAGKGLEERFQGHQRALSTQSPLSDSTRDQRRRLARFEASLRSLDVEMPSGFAQDVDLIETLIHDDDQFRSVIHADAGPQNFLYSNDGGRLIDLEFVTVGNVFCDLVGPRLGFPQTMLVGGVPERQVTEFEDAYADAISPVFDGFNDRTTFRRGLAAGAGHWALNRWSSAWNDRAPVERRLGDLLDGLARNHLVMDGFASLAAELSMFEVLGTTVARLMAQVREVTEMEGHAVYPAFQE